MDEANSTGVIGKNDAGCVEYLGYTGRELIQMGTLSKALGSLGGYITGSRTLIDFLRNRSCTQLDLYHSPFTRGCSSGISSCRNIAKRTSMLS